MNSISRREQDQQPVAVHDLPDRRTGEGANQPGGGEDQRRPPADMPRARVRHQIGEGIDRDRERAGADGLMRVRHPHDVEQQRHRQNRTAAADEAEREADDHAAADRRRRQKQVQLHRSARGDAESLRKLCALSFSHCWIGGPVRCCDGGNGPRNGGKVASAGLSERSGTNGMLARMKLAAVIGRAMPAPSL